MRVAMDIDKAKAVGRYLFQKYDIGKRGVLGPKQCFEVFSDFCYRILTVNPQPTMEEANSMHEILDFNKDKVVTQADFENLAVKYLCGGSNSRQSTNFRTSTVTTVIQVKRQSSGVTKNLTSIARRRLDVARRLFKMFDKDNSGYLTEEEIPLIITETYKQMGQNYAPTKEDVKSYMKMVDSDSDGRISLNEFEEIILKSLKNAGIQIYE